MRTLDWQPRFDTRSRHYPIRALHEGKPVRGRGWNVPVRLDQGREGACVGFAWTHELAATPARWQVSDSDARGLYHAAQKQDEFAGEDYEGTSVLAGAKVVHNMGAIDEYRWCFSLDDILLALSYEGPVVMGTWWYEGMFDPSASGVLSVTGDQVGGHSYLLSSVQHSRSRVVVTNSWGRGWGRDGQAYLPYPELARLLAEGGEACVPMGRHKESTQ